jgi:hypothetical protein
MSKADKLLKRVEFYEKMASAQKSEAGELLNKASLFERLALYSDRSSFLQALAQDAIMEGEQSPNPTLRPYGGGEAGKQWEAARQTEFGNQRTIPKPEPLAPLTPAQEAAKAIQGPADMTFQPESADKITGFAPIDTAQQEALSKFVTMQRLGIPLHRIDGKLGPATRAALEAARKYLTEKSPTKQQLTDKQVLQTIKYIVDNAPETYGVA